MQRASNEVYVPALGGGGVGRGTGGCSSGLVRTTPVRTGVVRAAPLDGGGDPRGRVTNRKTKQALNRLISVRGKGEGGWCSD